MALSKTAAERTVNEEYEVSSLLDKIDFFTAELKDANDELVVAKGNYDWAVVQRDERKDVLVEGVTTNARKENSKVSQTAVDGQVKLALAADDQLGQLELELGTAKRELYDAQRNVDNAKAEHRGHLAKMQLAGSALQFLGLTKSARATALEIMREL